MKKDYMAIIMWAVLFVLPMDQALAKGSSAGKSGRAYSSAHSSPRVYNKRAAAVGIYKFTAANGKQYIGKSIDIGRRLKEHMRSGKLKKANAGTVTVEKYNVSNKALSVIERTKIRTADIVSRHGLANKQHAPFSRTKEKAAKAFNERKEKIKEKVSNILKKSSQ